MVINNILEYKFSVSRNVSGKTVKDINNVLTRFLQTVRHGQPMGKAIRLRDDI